MKEFQVNYLSHFILCNRLVDVLERNNHGRIVVVGSVLHSWYVPLLHPFAQLPACTWRAVSSLTRPNLSMLPLRLTERVSRAFLWTFRVIDLCESRRAPIVWQVTREPKQ